MTPNSCIGEPIAKCPRCSGNGVIPGPELCKRCKGVGLVAIDRGPEPLESYVARDRVEQLLAELAAAERS